ncbi:MAG: DUF3244 domain-containing protein [Arenimonas sp.]|uniref:hypothetical protein n=1 Tax=Arenimonas sp. TaxID=1872635 RepID=UPI0025C4BCC6|nr:hypothetical protein [Arenimonas sp.]MBW8366279.1 DUF3244 domain-containing protein [Arenimonas sp.]
MTRKTLNFAAAVVLATLSLSACQSEAPAGAPDAQTQAPDAAPAADPAATAPAPVAMATASISKVELGNALDADGGLVEAKTTFAPMDSVVVVIYTAGNDGAALARGVVGTRWLDQDGKVVHEESKPFDVAGTGTTTFQIGKMDGWPVGRYTIEISLDGQPAMSREFTVQ